MSEAGEVISQKTKDYAMRIEEQMLAVSGEFKARYWTLGLGAAEIKEKNLWEVRGFDSEQAYREYLGIGRSTYFRCRRLAMEVGQPLMKKELVTRARLNRLTLENAEQLLRLDERRRFSASWVEKALTMKESQFEAEVDHVVLNDTEPETATSESMGFIKIPVTNSQKQAIMMTMQAVAVEHGLEADDLGGIQEALAADWHNWHQTEVEQREAVGA